MSPAWYLLVFFVLPLWGLAGFADYLCHRASDIEHANGARESVLHWLMLAEAAVPLLMAMFLKVNALLFAVMILALIVHEITGNIDLRLAMATRKVSAFEHQVHSVLEIIPVAAILLVAIMHWGQAEALFGLGPERADFTLALKPPPVWYNIVGPFAAFALLVLLPYGEETWRGLKARRAQARGEPRSSQSR